MSDEKQIALFTKWADDKYGKALPPRFWPQMQRFQSYWECWQAAIASQQKPAPVLLTDEEIQHAAGLSPGGVVQFARAIESAVLRKNGWGG